MVRVSTILLLTGIVLTILPSCTWKKSTLPSVLLIVVEDLGVGRIDCSDDSRAEVRSGFEILCDEAVRFTHAYTPATLSQPALASILTARYPHDHGTVDNGNSFLSARLEAAQEIALNRGYRTAFFGGGAPIWRNSGINQGFETFDDNIAISQQLLYRRAHENAQLFLNWRESEALRRPFFSVLHLNDAQFVETPTVNDLGEPRPSNYQSQVEELDESLGTLFRAMRNQRIWDNTYVIVAGLSGNAPSTRAHETRQLNLFSERTRVALFMKPARPLTKKTEGAESRTNWKVDANVSLVDVGATIYEIVGREATGQGNGLPIVSLKAVLTAPTPDWQTDRIIASESGWARWRGLGSRRIALRKGSLLYIHDNWGRLYDLMGDGGEVTPVARTDPQFGEMRAPFIDFIKRNEIPPFSAFADSLVEKLDLGSQLWHSATPRGEVRGRLRALSRRQPDDSQLFSWRALIALRLEDWAELKELGQKAGQPTWSFVAARNLGEKTAPSEHPCVRLFVKRQTEGKAPSLHECPSKELLELLAWSDEAATGFNRRQSMEQFFREYTERALQEKIAEYNYVSGLNWDVPIALPDGPALADLMLALPEFRRYKVTLQRRTAR